MSDTKIGNIIDDKQQRDAIHIAIAPVIAGEILYPGQRIGFTDPKGTDRVGANSTPIGIVDPFLAHPVTRDERFYMFLFPNTVTGMRHHWAHPAFADEAAVTVSPDADLPAIASRKRLEEIAAAMGMTYAELMEGADGWISGSNYLNHGESNRGEFYSHKDEFWKHYEVVREMKVSEDDRESFFSCSC